MRFKASLLGLMASVTLAWTFMTPFGGVADETSYAIYASAVASGQGFGRAEVPAYVAALQYLPCFAFKPEVTADCQQKTPWASFGDEPTEITSDRLITISGYPEPYFWIVGQPSRAFSGFPAVYLMRLAAWAMGMALLALMVIAWPAGHRVSLVVATLSVSTPLVGSFFGAVNPNGFEIVSGLALAGLLGALLLKSDDAEQTLRGGATHLVSIFIAMSALSVAKPYSYVFTLMITAAFLLTAGVVALQNTWYPASAPRAGYRRPVAVLLLGLLGIAVLIGYASNGTYRDVMAARGTASRVMPIWDSNWGILNNFTSYALELIGILGWRDHSPPLFVLVLWAGALLAFFVFVFARLLLVYRILLAGFIVGVLWVIPVFSYQALGLLGGAPFQARYVGSVFCAIPFVAVAYLFLSNRPLEPSPVAERAPALVSWFFGLQVVSLVWSFLRFSVGFPLSKHAGFWRDFQWVPDYWVVAALALAVFLGTSVDLRRQLRGQAHAARPEALAERPGSRDSLKDRIRAALFS